MYTEAFKERWQCHDCNRILDPDSCREQRDDDANLVTLECLVCHSEDVEPLDPDLLCKELQRWYEALGYTGHGIRPNLGPIIVILETVFDL